LLHVPFWVAVSALQQRSTEYTCAAAAADAQGLTMFKNMPRQMFGRVQSKLFPM
jgi:hypothetical protein